MVKNEVIAAYLDALSSKKPVPGGGGASALAGAFGCSLALMVISFTVGKKKYAGVEEALLARETELKTLREVFLKLSDRDEEVFLPLSKAYGMKQDTEEEKALRASVMACALRDATAVPLDVMDAAVQALAAVKEVAEKGSAIVISDAAVAAEYLRTALVGASYNAEINISSMEGGKEQDDFSKRKELLLKSGCAAAAEIGGIVSGRIGA